jgi:hypothetical protein
MSFSKLYWIFTLSFECENKTPCFVRIALMDTQGKKKKQWTKDLYQSHNILNSCAFLKMQCKQTNQKIIKINII